MYKSSKTLLVITVLFSFAIPNAQAATSDMPTQSVTSQQGTHNSNRVQRDAKKEDGLWSFAKGAAGAILVYKGGKGVVGSFVGLMFGVAMKDDEDGRFLSVIAAGSLIVHSAVTYAGYRLIKSGWEGYNQKDTETVEVV
ncbi:MAG: hypothetical protein NT124_04320 [Candidatus Dependentiae bacterium]|nr:hypothetical protein [Candidatus Dependentiae bacterium]